MHLHLSRLDRALFAKKAATFAVHNSTDYVPIEPILTSGCEVREVKYTRRILLMSPPSSG
jgi:hypothetical protein